jgi:hypothetical protein
MIKAVRGVADNTGWLRIKPNKIVVVIFDIDKLPL